MFQEKTETGREGGRKKGTQDLQELSVDPFREQYQVLLTAQLSLQSPTSPLVVSTHPAVITAHEPFWVVSHHLIFLPFLLRFLLLPVESFITITSLPSFYFSSFLVLISSSSTLSSSSSSFLFFFLLPLLLPLLFSLSGLMPFPFPSSIYHFRFQRTWW